MRCPICRSLSRVLDTRQRQSLEGEYQLRRRRECLAHPEHHFSTVEYVLTKDATHLARRKRREAVVRDIESGMSIAAVMWRYNYSKQHVQRIVREARRKKSPGG